MRIRTIKPTFWQHRMHRHLTEFESLLAVALISYADDEGRFDADPHGIRSLLFTYRDIPTSKIEAALAVLAGPGIEWITLYANPNDPGSTVGVINTFKTHQVINRPVPSSLPLRDDSRSTHGVLRDDSRSTHGVLRDDSFEPEKSFTDHSRIIHGGRKEGRKGKEGKEGKKEGGGGEVEQAPPPTITEGKTEPAPGPINSRTEPDILKWGAEWPGDMARGIPPGIPETWTLGWLAMLAERSSPIPPDWKRAILLRFRGDWIAGHPKARGVLLIKTGADSPWNTQQRVLAAAAALERHPGNILGRCPSPTPTDAERAECQKMRADLKKLIQTPV